MEVGETVLALNLIDPELDLAECVLFVLLKIGEGDFENPALQRIVCVLHTGRTIDEGLPNTVPLLDLSVFLPGGSDSYSRTLKVEGAWKCQLGSLFHLNASCTPSDCTNLSSRRDLESSS